MRLFDIICSALFLLSNVIIYCADCNYDEALARPVMYMPAREERDKEYVKQQSRKDPTQQKVCPFCRMNNEHDDKTNFVLARYKNFMIALNLYPYSRGHLLILPYAHVNNITDLNPESLQELMALTYECVKVVQTVGKSDGVNVGINIGAAAGASVPDHLHMHIVPRFAFEGRSFVSCIAEARVIHWNLNALYEEFYPAFHAFQE